MRPGSDNKRDPGSDVYMIAGVLYEALSGGNHIEDPLDVDGKFVHEKGPYRLVNFVDDPRVVYIEIMLRRCLTRDPSGRYSASELRSSCLSIRNWQPGEDEPSLTSRQLEDAEVIRRATELSPKLKTKGAAY